MYQPLSAYTGRDEDPDQVVNEWEQALRGDEAQDAPDAAARAIDPPTRRWTRPVPNDAVDSARRTTSPPRPSRARDRTTAPGGSLFDVPDRGTSVADDSTFEAFSGDSYLPPAPDLGPAAERPEPEPEGGPAPERAEAVAEPALERTKPDAEPASEPKPVPKPKPERQSEPKWKPEEPERPGAVAEQLFGTYPGVEEHVAT
ncbi:MAG: hypothetical protein J2P20_17260, partial [Pseudonocardia sp.]|nr:hypothetical protein [Pseudonocardia sp.]